MKSAIDRTGKTYGQLTVLHEILPRKKGRRIWRCVCLCGVMTSVHGYNLPNGHTTSCGCLQHTGNATRTHGTSNNGSISGNQVTLTAGTYYFELEVPITDGEGTMTIALYNVTDNSYIRRKASGIYNGWAMGNTQPLEMNGQFTITSQKTFKTTIVVPFFLV
jgi:hypothetical protein